MAVNKQKEIKVINDPVEAVRKLPDVYIGALGNHGYINMLREIIQNSLDEIIKGNTLDKNIIVSFDARNLNCIIEDNGQGIALDMLAPVFSVLHSSSNYDKAEGSGEYSSGKNGMGATITNFLSKYFVVESYRMDGTAAKVEFSEGRLSSKGTEQIECPVGKHGLITSFAPSDMMGEITVDDTDVERLLWNLCHLCLIGTKIIYNTINRLGQKRTVVIDNKHGIADLILCNQKVINPIYFIEDNGTMKVECLFTFDMSSETTDPVITGFANMCPTNAGTHIDGLLDGIVKYFRDYMNKIYLVNNKKLQVTAQDIKCALSGVISVFHIAPMFTGQSKEVFSKTDMRPFVTNTVMNALNNWASTNPADLQKISKFLKEICEIRIKSETERVKMTDKYTSSVVSGMPAKYKKPNSNKPFELWITEGDSACSGIENNRDKSTQGLFPIRGKMPNAFTTPTKKYFENEEVCSIFKICGYTGYSRKFDPAKFKPDKIVVAADADPDGKHIVCLVFGLFLRYLPFVIESGKFYVANPPLFGLSVGKKDPIFFSNKLEYTEYAQASFYKENTICSIDGNKFSKRELALLLSNNSEYLDKLRVLCANYKVDMDLMEFILYNCSLSKPQFKRVISKYTPYSKFTENSDTLIMEVQAGSMINTIFLNPRMIKECEEVIDIINASGKHFIINGTQYTLGGLLKLFNSYQNGRLEHYKGLGEMNPKLLGTSTVIPGYGRTLIQFTIEDAKNELATLTALQSDKSAFIKGIKINVKDII